MVKDNIDTADMPTTGGSVVLRHSIPPDDAFLVAKLRQAGAIILAKTNLHELARAGTTVSSLGGQTRNPYDLTRTPGGSSGGTAAAVAADFAVAGLGTDTVNSVRSPASACSLVGLRPTHGLLSRDGIIPVALSQDTAGPITRCVADAALLLDVLQGFDPADPATVQSVGRAPKTYAGYLNEGLIKGKKIGILQNLFGENEAVNERIAEGIKALESLGADIISVNVDGLDADDLIRHADVQMYETIGQLNEYFASLGSAAPVKSVRELLNAKSCHASIVGDLETALTMMEKADKSYEIAYKQKLSYRAHWRNKLLKVMEDNKLDAFVYPHQKVLVASIGDEQKQRNGIVAAITGFPAITVPAGFSARTDTAPLGISVGMELLGKPWSEPDLIAIAYAFERFTQYQRPPKSVN